MDNWYRIQDKLPEVGDEVQIFNEHYKHEDYNPNGVTFGFLTDEKNFEVAMWDNEFDYWDAINYSSNSPMYPTHWQPKAVAPKT